MKKSYNTLAALVLMAALPTTAGAEVEIEIFGANPAGEDQPFSFSERVKADYDSSLRGQEASFVFAESPGITNYADSGSYQGYSYFRLRGIDQTRINVTLDGVPLNEPEDQGAYFSNYPDVLNSLAGFQIIRGVGTSQNGTASYAGSILLSSPDLRALASEAGFSAGAFGSARVFAQRGVKLDDGAAVFIRASELHSDGYRRRSGNDAQSLVYKWDNLRRDNNWSLTGVLGHQQNELAYIGATAEQLAADRRANGNSREDDNFFQSLSQLQNRRSIGAGGELTTTVYYNHLQGNYDFDLNNFLGLPSTSELYNYGLSSHFAGAFSNFRTSFGQNRVTLGVHGNWYQREHVGSERALGTLYENRGVKEEASVFAKYERALGDFMLLSDLQLRRTTFNYHGSVPLGELGWTFFNPKAGVTYLLSNDTSIFYSLGRTGREPTRNDMFLGNDELLADDLGNPLLGVTQPEHVVDQELGVRAKGASWSLESNLFLLNFDHEIALSGKLGPTGLPLTASVENSYRTGIEFQGRWDVETTMRLKLNGAVTRSRIRQEGQNITPVMTPSFVGSTGAEFHHDSFRIEGEVRYQGASYLDFANTSTIGGFSTVNLSGHYTRGDVELGLHLNNILNRSAYTSGYVDGSGQSRYFSSAPRNLFVSAAWKF